METIWPMNKHDGFIPQNIAILLKIPAFKELVKLYTGEPIMLIDHDGPRSTQYPEGRP